MSSYPKISFSIPIAIAKTLLFQRSYKLPTKYLTTNKMDEMQFLPKAKTQLYCPLRTNNLASINADDADEQLLFVLNTGTPVRPSSERSMHPSEYLPRFIK